MIIWRGAVARSGGTVCWKVVEYLFQRDQSPYLPVPGGALDRLATFLGSGDRRALQAGDPEPENVREMSWIGGSDCYFHPVMEADFFRVIFVQRDLRECFVSYRKLHHASFEVALENFHGVKAVHDRMLQLPDEVCLKLDYASDVLKIEAGAEKIAAFIGRRFGAPDRAWVKEFLSQERVRERLEKRAGQFFEDLRMLHNPATGGVELVFHVGGGDRLERFCLPRKHIRFTGDESAPACHIETQTLGPVLCCGNADGTVRPVFNYFQQNHITTASGDSWKSGLSAAEIARVNGLLGTRAPL